MANVRAREQHTSASARRRDGYLRIGDYAAIGDGRTLALVGADGCIDWMCLPELDSPSVFAALLDPPAGGCFELTPAIPFEVTRGYVPQTNVLQTTFSTANGSVCVTDALTLDSSQSARWRELARRIEGVSGEVPMSWRWEPRFDYGRREAELERFGEALVARGGAAALGLQGWDVGAITDGRGEFVARAGEESLLVMTAAGNGPLPLPKREAVLRRLEDTIGVWRSWVKRSTYSGPWVNAVERSLLAIRLLADGRTGAIAAAGTTSLPEVLGGRRNYDYRLAWVRDTSFTLDALLAVGVEELPQMSLTWLLDAVSRTHPRIDPVYALDGRVVRNQSQIDLPGYRATQPVHAGNQAGSQLQLGGFGDLLETIHSYVTRGHVLAPEIRERLGDVVDLLCLIWRQKDSGLWELDDSAHYGTSKLGCWVAVERSLNLVELGQAPRRHEERWRRERHAMAEFIDQHLWSDTKQSYVQKAGGSALDCGMLLAARRGFGDPGGERINGTIDAIRRELDAGGGLLFRYSGMESEENAFLACSFWLVQALALAGRTDQAAELMNELVPLANDVGLYSEEIEPGGGELRGNFPQALSHLALINAAAALERAPSG
jgi:GH15 family glucan-1,4-alpha-glucosidase